MLAQTQDEEQVITRVAALDIGTAELVCCVRVPDEGRPGRRLQEAGTYPTMTRALLSMAGRLACLGVTRVIMEAASDYRKPAFYLLEAHGFGTWLVSARDVKHLPGLPKTDKLDAVWLAKVAGRQMIRPSFVPPAADPAAARCDALPRRPGGGADRGEAAGGEAAGRRVHQAQRGRLGRFGVSGRAMLAALIGGQRDPKVLAQLARGVMRGKITALQEAFTGYFTDHHAFLLEKMLARADTIDAGLAALDERIGQMIAPHTVAARRLAEIPGISSTAACAILAETGTSMDRFPTAGHLVSWAKFAPRHQRVRREEERQGHHRARQPLPGPDPRQRRRLGRPDRHLPGRAVPAHRPPPRRQESHRRHRPLPARNHLAPARRPRNLLYRPGPRLLRHPHQPRTPQAQPHPPAPGPRLQGHPRTRGLTYRQPSPAPLTLRRAPPRTR